MHLRHRDMQENAQKHEKSHRNMKNHRNMQKSQKDEKVTKTFKKCHRNMKYVTETGKILLNVLHKSYKVKSCRNMKKQKQEKEIPKSGIYRGPLGHFYVVCKY